ncbi:uncharacterized protein K02A2.6-like [Anopheles arabiensis]|uniref:uncharacterized protein K02A2.6-like n=1 Tax=Anopheles arabiensis TaxID=7173 RepID=UPI001AAD930C|nr:uncharacterized protein K02A2.6-like [Anopheles arabiensis]
MERNGEPSPSRSSHDPSQRTVTNLPLDTNAFIQDIFKQQQEILHQQQQSFLQQQEQLITKVLASIGSRQPVGNEHIIDALAKHIQEFHYDPEDAVTFSAWFARYEDLFERDAERLDDAARVRLLLRKLGAAEHERYVSHILPAKLNDFDFRSTTGKLRKLFGSPESVIAKRYRCLQMCKLQEEDYMTYSCRVNKAVIESELGKLSEEELKCLIFVCGLKDDNYSEIRIRLLNRLEEKSDKTVTDMAEECKRMVNLKRDTAMIGEGEKSVSIVRGSREKYPKKEHQAWKQPNKPNAIKCWLCGEGHHARKCFHKSYKCNNCHRYGHKEGYCESALRWANRKKRCVKSVIVNRVNSASRGRVNLFLNNTQIPMMVDTGADISIISSKQWHAIGSPALIPASVKARTASGDPLHILGEFQCDITIGQQCKCCTIRVTEADLMLLGADLMDTFGLWNVPLASICSEINVVEASENTKTLQKAFPALFSSKLGRCTKGCVKLMLKEGVTPVFRPKRPVAYAMLQAVDDELLRLENDGIITRVEYSDWAAPIVVVRKANGTIRICGDYSTGLNNALMAHQYPLPLPEEIFANLSNCVVFSQIDLSDAFLQVEVDENHRGLLTVNTHRGLFRYNRLPPGVKAAPGAFQQLIDTMLAGLDGVAAYMDDIVVGGKDMATHNGNLRAVLEKLQEYGFTIRASKCNFYKSQIKYLGHLLDGKGLRPDPDKIKAILKLLPPTDVPGVRSFLGAINFYGKFVHNMRMLRHPLDDLLKEGKVFCWTPQCQHAFEQFKKILSSDLLLTHYNPRLDIIVSADASSIGLGATISHRWPDGKIKVVQHASRALTAAEQRYSQPDREGLAIIFAVTKFHRMLFGRHFLLQTDHQPLLRIFGSKKGIPVYTANRLQRFALTLLLYDFEIEYVPTEKFGNADVLSRLMDKHEKPEQDFIIASIELDNDVGALVKNAAKSLPLAFEHVARESHNDPLLQVVYNYIQSGWPKNIDNAELKYFYARRESLSTIENCICFGERLVIPASQRRRVLEMMHRGHPGIDRMKAIARSYVYWPLIDADVEKLVKLCKSCALAAKSPIHSSPISWPKTDAPWQRVHIDYAGPIDGVYFLLVIDSFSKWPEIISTSSISANATVTMLRGLCVRFGMPNTIVSDNGRQFTSAIFADFCNTNGIEHIKTAPYHPQSNGQAERFVDSFKRALKKIKVGKVSLQEALDTFLLTYRSTPNKQLEGMRTPAEVMFERKIRTCLELLRPPVQVESTSKQMPPRKFHVGETVYAKEYRNNSWSWIPGEITKRRGNVMYEVQNAAGKKWRSHINQLRPRLNIGTHTVQPDATETSMALNILLDECRSTVSDSFT